MQCIIRLERVFRFNDRYRTRRYKREEKLIFLRFSVKQKKTMLRKS